MPECKSDKDPCDDLPVAGESWSVCLPFGGRLWADGNGVHAAAGSAPPDGVYGKVVIADGCLIGVEPEDVPLYTGSPCAPVPCTCEEKADLGGGFVPGNTIITCEIEAGANIQVSGEGTTVSPYVISADSGIYLRSDNSAIAVTGSGTRQQPYIIKHKDGLSTTVKGMTFDAFGHLTDYNEDATSSTQGVAGIVPGFGVTVEPDQRSGLVTVGLQQQPDSVPGNYQLGAYDLYLDKAGRVAAVTQQIVLEGAPLIAPCGSIDLEINQYGSVSAVTDTMNLGAGYLFTFGTADAGVLRSAAFTMRCNSALAGVCYSNQTALASAAFTIDGQPCEKINNFFWGAGVYLMGEHTLEVTGVTGPLAILLHAVSMVNTE